MDNYKLNYIEKLKDPRWQKKRLEILQRDDWVCQACYDKTSTLVVHHREYLPNTDPWDYPDNILVTLCETCHTIETMGREDYERAIIELLRKHFLCFDLHILRTQLLKVVPQSGKTASSFHLEFTSKDIWKNTETNKDIEFSCLFEYTRKLPRDNK